MKREPELKLHVGSLHAVAHCGCDMVDGKVIVLCAHHRRLAGGAAEIGGIDNFDDEEKPHAMQPGIRTAILIVLGITFLFGLLECFARK